MIITFLRMILKAHSFVVFPVVVEVYSMVKAMLRCL